MFLMLAFIVLSTSYVSSIPQPTTPSSHNYIYGVTHTFIGHSTVLAYPTGATWAAVTRRIHDISTSTPTLKSPRAISYDFADASDDITNTEETTDAAESLETGTSVNGLSSPTSTLTNAGTSSAPETISSATPISTSIPFEASPALPDASLLPSSIPTLSAVASLEYLHPIIPILIGSVLGILVLISTIILLVYCRRHRTRSTPRRWFNSNEKKDSIVSFHVQPPTAPLKGILVQNPTPFSLTSAEAKPRPDRVSLTSSQLSVIINNLPKTYDSGLESGVLDDVRAEGRGSPIQARRIGPSPSDFFVNLFSGSIIAHSSSESAASQALTSPHQSPGQNVMPVPRRDNFSPLQVNRAFVHPHTPTFPPSAAASPNLGFANGPRGHGLVLTGDLNAMVPSFAQWQYQRTAARGRDGNGAL